MKFQHFVSICARINDIIILWENRKRLPGRKNSMAKRSPETITEEEKRKRSERARKAAQAPRRMTEAARRQRSEAGKKHGVQLADQIAAAKALLKKESEKHVLPAYTRSDIMAARIANYVVNARRTERPLTETGIIVALGITADVYKLYANGERDHLQRIDANGRENNAQIQIEIDKLLNDPDIESIYSFLYSDTNNDIGAPYFSSLLQKARLLVTLEREERLAKSGRVGDIFTMKAREHWQDGSEHKTNVLQITTRNATEALQLLGFKQEGKD